MGSRGAAVPGTILCKPSYAKAQRYERAKLGKGELTTGGWLMQGWEVGHVERTQAGMETGPASQSVLSNKF